MRLAAAWPLRILAIVAIAAGGTLLALVAGRRNPWEMSHVAADSGILRVHAFGLDFGLPLWVLYATALLVLAGAVAASGGPGRRWLAPGVVATLLTLTLIPATARGTGVVLQLVLGSLGILLVATGLARRRVRAGVESMARAIASAVERAPGWSVPAGAFAVVFVLANLGSLLVLGHVPHVVDAIDQLFHARMFLTGETWAASPQPGGFFEFTHMIDDGDRWYSQYPPGHVAVLAVGLLLGLPWAVNPLLGALSVALLYFTGREIYGESVGRWAAICGALSPFIWLMASSFMSHTTMLFVYCAFLWGYARMVRRGDPVAAGLAGLALGYGLNVRPMTAAALAAPFVLHAAIRLFRAGPGGPSRRRRWLCCVLLLLMLAIPAGVLLAFNQATNGDPLVFGYEKLYGADASPGFGKSGWWDQPHTPARGLVATANSLVALNQYLFGLPLPSLLLPLLGFAWRRPGTWDALLLASIGCLLLAYFFYWYHDWAYGPRFLFSAVVPLALLGARTLVDLPEALERRFPGRRAPGFAALVLLLSLAYAWSVNVPRIADFYSRNYAGTSAEVSAALDRAATPGSVVLVPNFYYAAAFPKNAPPLDGPVIHARDLGDARIMQLVRRFPGREFYRLRSLGSYVLQPYDPRGAPTPEVYPVTPGVPLTVEALAFQVSHFAGGRGGNRSTAELGGGWMHHDQLWVAGETPGVEVGFILEARQEQRRRLTIALTRSPDSGTVEILLNGELLRSVDLHGRDPGVVRVVMQDVPIRRGRNGLTLRVVGKSAGSPAYGMGLDYFSLD